MKNFTELSLNVSNLDTFFIRKAIFSAIKSNISLFKGKLLDIGCGKMPYKSYIIKNSLVDEYIGIDIANARDYKGEKPDFTWDGQELPFDNSTFNTIISTEVLEHVPNLSSYLKEVKRVLAPNGIFFGTTPFIWPLHEIPYDEARYTPFALKKIFEEVSFTNITITALGGWNASFAQMIGLWARRGLYPKIVRQIASFLVLPMVYLLIKTDKIPLSFQESTMYTNLSFLVKN